MSNLMSSWNELKVLIGSLEVDVVKNATGNKSAGVRARKGLRLIKGQAAAIVKLSLQGDKT